MKKTILTVIGARPQFVKAAVVSRLIRSAAWRNIFNEVLVHTGQHFDDNMSSVFFREMHIPEPDLNLGIGGGGHGVMTGAMLAAIEQALQDHKPDLVMVYGDTNSTLAGALAASKLHIPVAHVEAGLRSFDKRMPEEQNRIVADHLATWLLCPTITALKNLRREGIENTAVDISADNPRVSLVGDVMYDASLFYRSIAATRPERERAMARLGLEPGGFRLMTLHRAENTDDPARLSGILEGIAAGAGGLPVMLPLHPRTRQALVRHGLTLPTAIRALEPLGYLDMIELEEECAGIVTDSGGVQKEAYFFGKACVTLRDSTEWVETVETGWNRLTGADPHRIAEALGAPAPAGSRPELYGTGVAGESILQVLVGDK